MLRDSNVWYSHTVRTGVLSAHSSSECMYVHSSMIDNMLGMVDSFLCHMTYCCYGGECVWLFLVTHAPSYTFAFSF